MKKIYIGIDPDLRLLNAAIISEDKKPLAVFIRRNKEGIDNTAVVGAARASCRLVEDVIAWVVANGTDDLMEIVTIVESQNMQHALRARQTGKQKIVPDDIRRLAQVAGCLMGAFSNLSTKLVLVQAQEWKGEVPKEIHHKRIYGRLALEIATGRIKNASPRESKLTEWSKEKINPGDFADINDSLGLALYGAEKGF